MFNIGPGELLVIAAVALIVLGPDRLPGALRSVGRFVGEVRRMSSGFQDEIRTALDEAEIEEVRRSTLRETQDGTLTENTPQQAIETTATETATETHDVATDTDTDPDPQTATGASPDGVDDDGAPASDTDRDNDQTSAP